MELLIVTGMSGAGKSVAANALEDSGFLLYRQYTAGTYKAGSRAVAARTVRSRQGRDSDRYQRRQDVRRAYSNHNITAAKRMPF